MTSFRKESLRKGSINVIVALFSVFDISWHQIGCDSQHSPSKTDPRCAVAWLGVPFSVTTSQWSKTDYDACVCMIHSNFNNWSFLHVKTAENNAFPSLIHFFFWEQASLRLSLWTFQTFIFFLLRMEQVLPSSSVWARLCRQQGLNKFNKIIATRQPVQILWFGI